MNSIDSKDINDLDQEVEIDLKVLFLNLKSYWHVIVLGILIGSLVGIIYIGQIKTPMYEASSMVYLRGDKATISLQDLQVGSQLTNDYEIIFKSRPVLEKVINKLNLEFNVGELNSMISISNPTDTRILTITVTSIDANLSKDISNELVYFGMERVREIDSQEPYLIESAVTNTNKVGMSASKTALLGAAIGMMIAIGLIVVKYVMSDNVQSVEDIERSFKLPVLAVVVDDKALNYANEKSQNKKVKRKIKQFLSKSKVKRGRK
ncbi:MAG: Wzz/FepE/Etk N-terminal domain-containing protein [Coprobacillus sp.]